jgi:hypothetical protein
MHRLALLAFLLLLSTQLQKVTPQSCGSTDVKAKGAKGDGRTDDTGAFVAVEADATAGVIFMPAGTYRITRSITLVKPIVAVAGAQFLVSGAGLGPHSHCLHRTFF